MIGYFVLGLCTLAGLLLLIKWYSSADPKILVKVLPGIAIFAVAAIALLAFLIGRPGLLLAVAFILWTVFNRFRAVKNRFKAAVGPQPGQTSEVVTRYFRMTLDHDSGGLSGDVLDGSFAGRVLDDLTPEELLSLWQEIVIDAQSASVLESYLNRRLGDDWQDDLGSEAGEAGAQDRSGWGDSSSSGGSASGPPPGGAMSPQQAYEILGLEIGASKQEIREAHRRLLQKIHPDHGGSNFLAAQINRAKDVLIKN